MSTKSSSPKRDSATMKSRTRHTSSGRPPTKGGHSKHDDAVKEVSHLTECVKNLEGENEKLKERLRTLSMNVMEAGAQNGEEIDYDPNTDILDVPVVELLSVVAGLNNRNRRTLTPRQSKNLEENRLEDLETRVTQLNVELGKLLKLKLKVENGLQDIDRCRNYEEARRKAKYLWYESSACQLFVTPQVEENTPPPSPPQVLTHNPVPVSQTRTTSNMSNGFPPSVRINLERVHIATPPGKLPGETHINNMHKDLQKLIIQELSLYKGNGADWRMFSERVGIPAALVTQWRTMKLPQPMRNVLFVWGESPSASVRMLHRHLVSPQLKCVMLAKRLSDFYQVD